jgi:hypothetical protein
LLPAAANLLQINFGFATTNPTQLHTTIAVLHVGTRIWRVLVDAGPLQIDTDSHRFATNYECTRVDELHRVLASLH